MKFHVNVVLLGRSSRGDEMGGHVACIGRRQIHTNFLWRNLKESDYLVDLA